MGIHTGGVPLASRICDAIAAQAGHRPHEGMIDITLYRDDVFIGLPNPVVGRTELPFDMDGTRLVLVEGLHRLEACKALGEETIIGMLVQARQH